MSSERKVAVITGASRGMGAALVKAYRELLSPVGGFGVLTAARDAPERGLLTVLAKLSFPMRGNGSGPRFTGPRDDWQGVQKRPDN
jgi:NAD(P)-dependent dehydrogenase (short-subunit alcohol dehydrogenase family)